MLFASFCSKCPLSKNYWREVSRPCHGCQCQLWGHDTSSPDTLAPPWAPRCPSCTLGEWLPHHTDTQTLRQRLLIHQGLQHQSSKWFLSSSVFFHCYLNHLLLLESEQQKQIRMPVSTPVPRWKSLGSHGRAGICSVCEVWGRGGGREGEREGRRERHRDKGWEEEERGGESGGRKEIWQSINNWLI